MKGPVWEEWWLQEGLGADKPLSHPWAAYKLHYQDPFLPLISQI